MRLRSESRSRPLNRIDPVYQFLDRIVFRLMFQPPKASKPGAFERLERSEEDFLVENLGKHRTILWINVLLASFLGVYGLEKILSFGNTAIVVTGLLAPAMITGAAWYAVSFGGIPEKFISVAYYLTLSMFLSFTLSMTLLTCLLLAITPWEIGALVIAPIYLTLYVASMLYDNVDGLKIGLDSTLLKFSRANLNYYQKHGLITSRETQQESFGEGAISSGEIALFTYYLGTLERNLDQLQKERGLRIANHLITSSTDLLFNMLDLFVGHDQEVDRGSDFRNFLENGHSMDQRELDAMTFSFLEMIAHHLRELIDDPSAEMELRGVSDGLQRFSDKHHTMREETDRKKAPEETGSSQKEKDLQEAQYFADHIFSQTFRRLSGLMSAYRDLLFSRTTGNIQ